MLSLLFGYDENAVLNVDTYFNNMYDDEWFDDPFVRNVVSEVDGSAVQDRQCILSPVLGQIPPNASQEEPRHLSLCTRRVIFILT